MFHNTQVRERDLGAWKLWAEVSGEYSSFEFLHSHGLGVLPVGEHAGVHIKKVFSAASQFEYREFMRFFFSNIGQFSPLAQRLKPIIGIIK
jgi:O-antigen biosynthesis protein